MNDRRSFFERLTGTVRVAEPPEEAAEVPVTTAGAPDDRGTSGAPQRIASRFGGDPSPTDLREQIPRGTLERPAPALSAPDEAEGQLTVDVYQTPETIVVKSTIAGVKPEDLDVSITNDMVTIRGARRQDEEITEDDYFYRECYWGNFSRSIILPVDIVAEKADASLKDGILTIRIPKADSLVTKKVKVRGF